jgi:GntR family L-lactate dehydrogenase operon transcriptional regulator
MRSRDGETSYAYEILTIIHHSSDPVGARKLSRALLQSGISTSEATLGRLLRRLDSQALTRPVGAKGRVLTAEGRRLRATLDAQRRHIDSLQAATEIATVQDVIGLLIARRAIERECARSAALHASAEQVDALRAVVAEHGRRLEAREPPNEESLRFHRDLAALTPNQVLRAMASIAFDASLESGHALLDVIIFSHGTEEQGLREHRAILDAIARHDAQAADDAMAAHLSRLVSEVEAHLASGQGELLDRLLEWVRSRAAKPATA